MHTSVPISWSEALRAEGKRFAVQHENVEGKTSSVFEPFEEKKEKKKKIRDRWNE